MSTGRYPPTIFILGTDQNVGKTTTSMGIIGKLMTPEFGFSLEDIGYIKPVGQRSVSVQTPGEGVVTVDRDAWLISKLYGLNRRPFKAMSPVVWVAGSTAEFIDQAFEHDPAIESERLRNRIREAYETIAYGRQAVVCEGTGQSGVGSIAGVSNADVIGLLKDMGVPVMTVLVTRGGIGSTIDRLFPHLLSLTYMGRRIDGLVISSVHNDRMDKVRDYLQRYYSRIFPRLYGSFREPCPPPRILGLIPEVPELRYPTMRSLAEAFAGQQIDQVGFLSPAQPVDYSGLFVRGVKVVSLECGFETYLQDGDVFIVGINSNATILALLREDSRQKSEGRQGLSGLILSCSGERGLSEDALAAIFDAKVPTLVLPNDSADIVRRVSDMSVKIQPYDRAKKEFIDRAYAEHLDLATLRDRLLDP